MLKISDQIRTGIAALGLTAVVYGRGKRLPTDWRSIRDLAMQNRLEPIVTAAGAMLVASVVTGFLAYGAPLWGGTPVVSLTQITPRVLAALLALGLVNTFGAYLIFYSLIATLGAARTSMVTYVLPVVGLFFGALFLAEPIDGRLLLGAMLIMGSIGISNLKLTALVTLLQARRSSAL